MYRTRRLTIRKFVPRDLDALVDLFRSEKAMRHIGPRRPMRPDETRRWLDDRLRRQENERMRFAVEHTEEGVLSGVCGFERVEGAWDFGYYFRERYWGRGYATEACLCLLEAAEALLGADDFRVFVAAENPASGKVMRKCGFVPGEEARAGGERGAYYRAERGAS